METITNMCRRKVWKVVSPIAGPHRLLLSTTIVIAFLLICVTYGDSSVVSNTLNIGEMKTIVGGQCCAEEMCAEDNSCHVGGCNTETWTCKTNLYVCCDHIEDCGSKCTQKYDNENPLFCGTNMKENPSTGECTEEGDECGGREPNECTDTSC